MTQLTKHRNYFGNRRYMSPEQARGEKVDHRSDIWSLGVMLYEMVTGQPPFKGDYENAVVYSILNMQPEPMTGLRTGVPVELERIVGKALAKDPSERYQHVDEMLVDFEAAPEGRGDNTASCDCRNSPAEETPLEGDRRPGRSGPGVHCGVHPAEAGPVRGSPCFGAEAGRCRLVCQSDGGQEATITWRKPSRTS